MAIPHVDSISVRSQIYGRSFWLKSCLVGLWLGSGADLPRLGAEDSAVAAATRSETSPAAGRQVEQRLVTKEGVPVDYLLYLPKDYESGSKKQWPLMLFLHGRGESNGPLQIVAKWGPPLLVSQGVELPYILVSPQCPADDSWAKPSQQGRLVELLDAVANQFPIDQNRVYLTGLSMGGYGSWRLAADHPDRFAAVVPICGGGSPADAAKLKDLPIWVFHGDQDLAVPFSRSVEMVDAIRQAGGTQVRFTTLEHVGHNSWSAAYGTPELFDWLNQQQKKHPE